MPVVQLRGKLENDTRLIECSRRLIFSGFSHRCERNEVVHVGSVHALISFIFTFVANSQDQIGFADVDPLVKISTTAM